MQRLTLDEIRDINNSMSSDNQGIYIQPNGIPTHIKSHVIYQCICTGGISGGSCWDYSNPQYYERDEEFTFEILDKVLEHLKPDITYLEFKQIEKLIDKNEYSEREYYGNRADYEVQFLELEKLYEFLGI
jgi:hypothetical protein